MSQYDSLHDEVDNLETVEGISPLAATMLPDPFGPLLRKLIRQGSMTVEEIAAELEPGPGHCATPGEPSGGQGVSASRKNTRPAAARSIASYLARIRKHSIPLDL